MFCIVLVSVFTSSANAQEKFRALLKADSTPVHNEQGRLAGYTTDSSYIYFNQQYIVYKLTYTENTSNQAVVVDDANTPVNGHFTVNSSRKRDTWLVQERDSSYGYIFNERRPHLERWIQADSALTSYGRLRFEIDLSDKKELRCVKSVTDPATGIFHEAYMMQDSIRYPKDTICFSYSNRMTSVPFSLNTEIDRYTGKKLFYVRFVTAEREIPELKVTLEKHETITRFEETPVIHNDEVLKYIERFRLLGKRKPN